VLPTAFRSARSTFLSVEQKTPLPVRSKTSPKPTPGESARFHLSDYRLVARHNLRVARHSPTTYEAFSGVASDSATSGRPVRLSAPHDITRCVEPPLVVRARRATPVSGTP